MANLRSHTNYLPITLQVANKKLLFIGGGKVCVHKIAAVKQFTCDITILSENFLQEVIDYGFSCIKKTYESADIDGFSIVYACTNNREINKKIAADCKSKGILINVADDPELCDFISPAIYKEGDFSISISSGGTNVLKAVQIRNSIREQLQGTLAESTIKEFPTIEIEPKVYLVGFGPGDPELLTIKAHRLLKEAEVIFYDNLINAEILEQYKAQKVYVGKRKEQHSKVQAEINEILYNATKQYSKIIRLKGGDPMIFGRVGEELQYLAEKGIQVEIVPGVTSASVSASICKIPLTQRGVSSSVAFCTGHPLKKMKIPTADTLVFYMGASTLQKIVTELLEQSFNPNTPVAIVTNASMPDENIEYYTLQKINENNITAISPSIIIVGEVVHLNNISLT